MQVESRLNTRFYAGFLTTTVSRGALGCYTVSHMQTGFLLLYVVTIIAGLFFFRVLRYRDKTLLSEITDMVHQLRAPLSGVKWTLKILLDGDTGENSEAGRELLLKGFAANERMIALVNDMLAVARLESGTFKYRFAPVQFEKLIEETIASFTPAVEAKDIRLEFVAQKRPLPKWNVDPEKMRNVLQNLLDNAIKYVRKGGAITVEAEIENEALHIVVKDDGMGIPDDAKEKIFTRFFRAANAMAAETNGSGLGLFIARNIVLAHNGKIWFESVLGKGTVFHVLLPERS